MSDDVRKGKVSASRLEILALCPGSEQLRRTLPDTALDTGDEYTDLGSKLHKAWETESTLDLNEEELEVYQRGIETLDRIIAEWKTEFQLETVDEGQRELRLYLNDPSTLKIVASGQLDRHYGHFSKPNSRPHVLICDFKGLWSPHLTPAERNWQGRLQAVLAKKEYDAKHVRMAFVKAMFGRQDVTDYDEAALGFAETSIFRAIWESEQPGAQRRAGPWCRYCPCKPFCREAALYSELPSVARGGALEETLKLVNLMPPEDIVAVWRKWGEVEKIFEAMEARLKALPEEEQSRLGVRMKEGRKMAAIVDKVGAFNALRALDISSEKILATVAFGKGELVALYQATANCSPKDAEAWYEKTLDPFIKRDRAKPSLVEI